MKTAFKISLMMFLAALSGACQNMEPEQVPQKELIYREFTATRSEQQTKTSLNGSSVLRNAEGETVSIIASDGTAYLLTQTSVSQDRKTATFGGQVPADGLVYAVYPSDGFAGYSGGLVSVSIPSQQNATAGSFADGASACVAKVVQGQALHFRNAGGLLGFTVNNSGITSIRLTATEKDGGSLTGPVLVDYSGDTPYCLSEGNASGASVELTGNIQSGTTYWAVVAPGTYSNLSLVFSDGTRTATFTKDAPLAVERNKQVRISPFTIGDKDWDGYVEPSTDFTLVTDASTLAVGDEVLIVYVDGSKALGALSSDSHYRLPVDVTISNNVISSPGSATILTLEEGISSGTWSFADGENYLASSTSSSKENYLLNSSSKTANSSWSVNIGADGSATIQAQSGVSTILSYNTGNPRFSCYTGGQKAVAIFRRGSSGSGGQQGPRVSVTTGSASAVTTISATIRGSWSGATATVREAGFHIGTDASNLDEVYQADITPATSGNFSVDLTLLDPNVKYFYRAYVILQDGSEMPEFTGAVASFTTLAQQDVPPAGSQPSWAELPRMNISTVTESGKQYMVNSQNTTEYYAWHICPDFFIWHPNKQAARNYTVCFSSTYHCPVWVAAPRHKSYETGSGRSGYSKDPDIPADIQYSSKDTGGGCNKGHMLGSAERTVTDATNKQVFYYTNIAPQLSS